ncbi:MAG: putative DCC family thiol-disulfide oxidoreductase YuxK [Myxococcota bacterium]|jgi:predicted DCC family thiol-disulfide oxidoreductase YuxK
MTAPALLVFDGDCGFCKRWLARWQEHTGDSVVYAPFQSIQSDQITAVEFAEAFHLFLPDGRVLRGAAAWAELDTRTPGWSAFAAAHRHIPGVAPVSEGVYRWVARYRGLADRLTRLTLGRDVRRPRYGWTRWLMLRLLAVTLLCATFSWWSQMEGLVGAHGIEPAVGLLDQVDAFARQEHWGFFEILRVMPTVLWLDASDTAMHWVAGLTALGGLLMLLNILTGLGVILGLIGYLSLASVGGTFMGFQWDGLLIESLVVALFLVPWRGWRLRPRGPDPGRRTVAGIWLARLLVWKLMFFSAWTKLLWDDPSWLDGTALDYHYWTQPLPSWSAFHAASLPDWTRTLGLWLMWGAELVLPWFIFVGGRRLRRIAFWGMLALQLGIAATGNYGYFNLLSIALLVSVMDDDALLAGIPARWRRLVGDPHATPWRLPRLRRRLIVGFLAAFVTMLTLLHTWRLAARPDPLPAVPSAILTEVAPLRFNNSYGLFRVMTRTRPEIAVEGSHDGETWRPYRFHHKPDQLDEIPGLLGPHMPRLDWQMWFAALGGECRPGWYPAFIQRLLEARPAVLGLMDGDPFPDRPPRYVRSTLYHYRFASSEDHDATGAWWTREEVGPFCPTLMLGPLGDLQVLR